MVHPHTQPGCCPPSPSNISGGPTTRDCRRWSHFSFASMAVPWRAEVEGPQEVSCDLPVLRPKVGRCCLRAMFAKDWSDESVFFEEMSWVWRAFPDIEQWGKDGQGSIEWKTNPKEDASKRAFDTCFVSEAYSRMCVRGTSWKQNAMAKLCFNRNRFK